MPLSSYALEIFRGLPQMVGNDHWFPSPVKRGKPLESVRRSWKRVRAVAGCEDLTLHGWRHTTATMIADAGFPAQAIQMALGHATIDQSLTYVHASDSLPRQALEEVGAKIRKFGDSLESNSR